MEGVVQTVMQRWLTGSVALLVVLAAMLFVVRVTAPSNLMDQDQERPAAYALDVLRNGEWIVQRDQTGSVTSKPPLYTWLVALAALPVGRISEVTLYLPGALAVLGTALLLLVVGRVAFGPSAGVLAAGVFLVSMPGVKMLGLARTDPLFTLTVALVALTAYGCRVRGWRWIWFWLACAATTLTKGPLGVLLGMAGLAGLAGIAPVMDRAALRRRSAQNLVGAAVFLILVMGWFALATWRLGGSVGEKMFGQELAQQVVEGDRGEGPLDGVYLPLFYFLTRFFPWSLVTCAALARMARRPAVEPTERMVERFLMAGLVLGLLVFSFAGHKRHDHVFPLVPFAALLAGRELSLLAGLGAPRRALRVVAAGGVVAVVAAAVHFHVVRADDMVVKRTAGMRELAAGIERDVGADFPLVYREAPFALQFYLNSMRFDVTAKRAMALLKDDDPVFVATAASKRLRDYFALRAPGTTRVRVWPESGTPVVAIYSNRPELAWHETMVTCVGPWDVELTNAVIDRVRPGRLEARARDSARPAGVRVTNRGRMMEDIDIRFSDRSPSPHSEGRVAAGESLSLSVQPPTQ